jgi:hypothetical protein
VSRYYQRQEHVPRFKHDVGGRLRGIMNTGQQVYGAAIIPNGLNPSVASATHTFRASPALSGFMSSKCLHASPSAGCYILSLYRLPFLCHVICFADSSVMYSRWSLCRTGRCHMTISGILDYFLLPSLPSTSTYLEALHFGQCVVVSWSPRNRTHPFLQAWIGSYDILSARRNLYDSYVLFGRQ